MSSWLGTLTRDDSDGRDGILWRYRWGENGDHVVFFQSKRRTHTLNAHLTHATTHAHVCASPTHAKIFVKILKLHGAYAHIFSLNEYMWTHFLLQWTQTSSSNASWHGATTHSWPYLSSQYVEGLDGGMARYGRLSWKRLPVATLVTTLDSHALTTQDQHLTHSPVDQCRCPMLTLAVSVHRISIGFDDFILIFWRKNSHHLDWAWLPPLPPHYFSDTILHSTYSFHLTPVR